MPSPFNFRNLLLGAACWAGLILLLCGCQSSVRITPASVEGTHEHTVTTITKGDPSPAGKVWHVHIAQPGDSNANPAPAPVPAPVAVPSPNSQPR